MFKNAQIIGYSTILIRLKAVEQSLIEHDFSEQATSQLIISKTISTHKRRRHQRSDGCKQFYFGPSDSHRVRPRCVCVCRTLVHMPTRLNIVANTTQNRAQQPASERI